MDFALTAEQAELQERARAAALEVVAPAASAERFDPAVVRELGRRGLLSSGAGAVESALIAIELGRIDSSVRGFVTVQTGLVSKCIADWGTEEQKRRWLPGLASGELIGCYALTEPGAGSDVKSIACRAVRNGERWLLSGEKHWITNGGVADLAIVFAVAEEASRNGRQAESPHAAGVLTAFLVETGQAGLTRLPVAGRELGHRNSDHARLVFDRCAASDVLGNPGDGFKIAMSALGHGRLGVAAGAVGVLRGCLDASVAWARDRVQFGKRLGDFEMIQSDLADIAADEAAARALVMQAAWLADAGRDNRSVVSLAKLFATEAAQRAAEKAVVLHGARGYSSELPVERHYRDIIGMRIYEGTSHIQRIIIARDLMGRPGEGKAAEK